MVEKFRRISKALTPQQKQEYDRLREEAKAEFPPSPQPQGPSEKGRIALAIRQARTASGLTFEQVAQASGAVDAETVRDIEYGSDAKLSDVTAVLSALGLRMELVSARS